MVALAMSHSGTWAPAQGRPWWTLQPPGQSPGDLRSSLRWGGRLAGGEELVVQPGHGGTRRGFRLERRALRGRMAVMDAVQPLFASAGHLPRRLDLPLRPGACVMVHVAPIAAPPAAGGTAGRPRCFPPVWLPNIWKRRYPK
jgi:hypothetical protein